MEEERSIEINKHSLPKDLGFSPFFKEEFLIVFFLLLYGVSSLSPFLNFLNVFMLTDLASSPFFEVFIEILETMLPLMNIAILFLNLNLRFFKRQILKTAILFLTFGLFFYGFECLLIYDFTRTGDFFNTTLTYFFPRNLFFATGIYALFAYFLFIEPKKKTKADFFFFRSMALLPVAFLLFSFIYEFLIVFDIVELNQYLHSLCASSAFPYSFFAIFYILGHKAIDRFFLRKYGEEQFAIYRYGNRYQYAKNILASFLFLVIFLLALILMKNEELSNLLSLRGMLYLPLLLPFILFYLNV